MSAGKAPSDWRPTIRSELPCFGLTEVFCPSKRVAKTYGGLIALAQSICATCEFQEPCHAEAEYNQEPFGVWGGENFEDRWRGKHRSQPLGRLARLIPLVRNGQFIDERRDDPDDDDQSTFRGRETA